MAVGLVQGVSKHRDASKTSEACWVREVGAVFKGKWVLVFGRKCPSWFPPNASQGLGKPVGGFSGAGGGSIPFGNGGLELPDKKRKVKIA